MKQIFLMLILCGGAAFGQAIDFTSLDHLASRAEEVNKISLNHDQITGALKLFISMSGDSKSDKDDMKKLEQLAAKVQSIEVRNFTFGKPGSYHESDLAAVRRQIESLKSWSKIVDSRDKTERSEIFANSGNEPGLAIISAEENELSVVVIKGLPDLKDLGGLSGLLGLPNIRIGPEQRPH